MNKITFTSIVNKLYEFWISKGATILPQHDIEIGAATFHPIPLISIANNMDFFYIFLQKCRRQCDGRYAQSPNRLSSFYQLQVIMQPICKNYDELLLQSLEYIGLDLTLIKYCDNNWNSESLGASGVGWEIRYAETEILQYTFFQKIGDCELQKIPIEFAYGIERLLLMLSNVESIYDCWYDEKFKYKDIFLNTEIQFSKYYLEFNKIQHSNYYELNTQINYLIENKIYEPAYELLLKQNNIFNELDALKKITLEQRKELIKNMRYTFYTIFKNFKSNKLIE